MKSTKSKKNMKFFNLVICFNKNESNFLDEN